MTHVAIFHMYDMPTFKTKVLCFVSNEGRVKHLLLLANIALLQSSLNATSDGFCY